MSRRIGLVALVAAAIVAALVFSTVAGADRPQAKNFGTKLSGAAEVPPVDTQAGGKVIFHLNKDGDELRFKLIVRHLQDAFAAHIHCGVAGQNGPVGVTLFQSGTPVTTSGILARGVITEPNPGNACSWADLGDVLAALRSGNTYVNVHTNGHPSGEIRGQIEAHGPG